jgi:hypothetical protein
MAALLTINKLMFTDVPDGKHFLLSSVDIGILVKFDAVGPCIDTKWKFNPWSAVNHKSA